MSTKNSSYLELVVCCYTRNNYEKKSDKIYVPMALKYLMIKFFKQVINSKFSTWTPDLNFLRLFQTKLPLLTQFQLLYRASDHYCSAKKFHELCDNKGATVTLIKSNHGNIYGGYTSKAWTGSSWRSTVHTDNNAFVFLIKSDDDLKDSQCPMIFPIKEGKERGAIKQTQIFGPIFGQFQGHYDIFIPDHCHGRYVYDNVNAESVYDYGDFNKSILYGGDQTKTYATFRIVDYEVFKIN